MAEIDALAFLDKVKEVTGAEKVTWVGHSQGATQMLYGLASAELQKEFQKRVNLVVALAPITRLDHLKSELILALTNGVLKWFLNLLGTHEVFGALWGELNKVECGLLRTWCEYGLTWIDASTLEYDDKKRLQVYQGHLPAGGSLRSL